MPFHPFTHRRHAISNDDYEGSVAHYRDAHPDNLHDAQRDDEPVTVSDLLDAYFDDSVKPYEYGLILDRASDDVFDLFLPVSEALEGERPLAALSPEERAEFDRRTT